KKFRFHGSLILVIVTVLTACGRPTESEKLKNLFEREWDSRLEDSPLYASWVGVKDYDDRLPDMTLENLQRQADESRTFLDELSRLDLGKLSREEQISAQIFRKQLEESIRSFEFGEYRVPMNSDSGFHTSIAFLPQRLSPQTVKDYDNYISRLRQIPRYFTEQTALMRLGLEQGMTLSRVVVTGIPGGIEAHVVEDVSDSVFCGPVKRFPGSIPADQQDRIRREVEEAIRDSVVPAYQALADFMLNEYMPDTRDSLGASELPEGLEYYGWLIRQHTTLDLSPDQVHQIGLDEVARIKSAMLEIIDSVGFEGGFDAFLVFLRTDPQFYAQTPDELLQKASYIAKRMDGKLPVLFKTLPRQPYTVQPVPEDLAPNYTSGRYVSAPPASTLPGIYWVNTHNLSSRPLYALPALTLHEAVPGHHLENALSQELTGIPNFRRFSGINAYGEGWGLYSEFLGIETGIYTTPYEDFGRLTYEMWRACRLVVDTGIHAMGWTRQQAIDYLASNTALSIHECTTETDRYISWPGQALAYKLGELKIRELRKRAEEMLGPAFDLRAFHDAILLNGPVPLTLLEDQIDRWISETQAR
ncbi:MAG: DUF885 domain-containing protein, partial [Acidobacteriota bacterium]